MQLVCQMKFNNTPTPMCYMQCPLDKKKKVKFKFRFKSVQVWHKFFPLVDSYDRQRMPYAYTATPSSQGHNNWYAVNIAFSMQMLSYYNAVILF